MAMTKVERVSGERAYILHVWPYRETSAIFDCLSERHSRVRLLARAVKGSKSGNSLRTFNCLSLSWSGRSELKSITGYELLRHRWLTGDVLIAGLYANELTLRSLRRHKAEESLFLAYQDLLQRLEDSGQASGGIEPPLRLYEFELLRCIGYGINLEEDSEGQELRDQVRYRFEPGAGLRPAADDGQAFPGKVLQGLRRHEFENPEVRRAAKQLTRAALAPHIGPEPILSRSLQPSWATEST